MAPCDLQTLYGENKYLHGLRGCDTKQPAHPTKQPEVSMYRWLTAGWCLGPDQLSRQLCLEEQGPGLLQPHKEPSSLGPQTPGTTKKRKSRMPTRLALFNLPASYPSPANMKMTALQFCFKWILALLIPWLPLGLASKFSEPCLACMFTLLSWYLWMDVPSQPRPCGHRAGSGAQWFQPRQP